MTTWLEASQTSAQSRASVLSGRTRMLSSSCLQFHEVGKFRTYPRLSMAELEDVKWFAESVAARLKS